MDLIRYIFEDMKTWTPQMWFFICLILILIFALIT